MTRTAVMFYAAAFICAAIAYVISELVLSEDNSQTVTAILWALVATLQAGAIFLGNAGGYNRAERKTLQHKARQLHDAGIGLLAQNNDARTIIMDLKRINKSSPTRTDPADLSSRLDSILMLLRQQQQIIRELMASDDIDYTMPSFEATIQCARRSCLCVTKPEIGMLEGSTGVAHCEGHKDSCGAAFSVYRAESGRLYYTNTTRRKFKLDKGLLPNSDRIPQASAIESQAWKGEARSIQCPTNCGTSISLKRDHKWWTTAVCPVCHSFVIYYWKENKAKLGKHIPSEEIQVSQR